MPNFEAHFAGPIGSAARQPDHPATSQQSKLSRDLAKANNKTIFGDTPAPGTFEAGRKVKEKAK